jgi:CelD/BcsL family acetyltransferase involved in cellulose biosynthesis
MRHRILMNGMRAMTTTMLKRADQLDATELAQWQRLRQGRCDLASPYFSPEFFQAVATTSRTARVAVGYDDAGPCAFLPLHKTASGIAVPIGGALNDLHGMIAAPGCGLEPAALLAASGTALMSLRHAPIASLPIKATGQRHAFHVVALSRGFAAWDEDRRSFAKSAFRAIRTRADKAAKLHGPLTFRFAETDASVLRQLQTWKRVQYEQTRQPDPLARIWVQQLIEQLHQTPSSAPLRGQLSSLWFGDRLAAAHFGLRSADILHYWFPAYDPAFAELSPGNLLLYRMIAAAAADGCTAVHLGAGDVRYKLEFANVALPVVATTAFAGSLAGRAAAATGQVLTSLGGALPERWRDQPAKAWRRLDRELALRAA